MEVVSFFFPLASFFFFLLPLSLFLSLYLAPSISMPLVLQIDALAFSVAWEAASFILSIADLSAGWGLREFVCFFRAKKYQRESRREAPFCSVNADDEKRNENKASKKAAPQESATRPCSPLPPASRGL